MSDHIIALSGAVGRNPLVRLNAPADFLLGRQEHVAIVGANGAGKTLLTGLLTGRVPLSAGSLRYDFGPGTEPRAYGNIVQLTFEDALGSVETPYYYQQRFNSQDRDAAPYVWQVMGLDETAADVRSACDVRPEHLASAFLRQVSAGGDGGAALDAAAAADVDALLDEFGVRPMLAKRIVLLSSGEMRRLHLFRALLRRPRVLILESPFIGLDAPMRDQLSQCLGRLAASGRVGLIVVQSMLDRVPEFVTHVVAVEDGVVHPRLPRADYLRLYAERAAAAAAPHLLPDVLRRAILSLPAPARALLTPDGSDTDEVVAIRNLRLALSGGRTLYGGLTWAVRRGERWALEGRNGSGKSTLLSLICADHPAAYACDVSLFGRRRGTGESIWDVKRHIGFVSPEFHRAYRENRPAIEIVASGLHDSVGLYRRPRPDQMATCRFWLDVFGIAALAERPFLTLSSGEQRLCLLARAFVKDPALLILDEPLHGLDTWRRERVRQVIEAFCQRPDKTLIMVSHYRDELPSLITRRLTLVEGGAVIADSVS